ncbi:MAG: histidine kinase [Flavobacteriales bacterium]|nr:histidine kinase [Flavobacteriales bacterium]MBK9699370.1 histidine kinase [Flavobacteriales bacterium]
MHGLTSTRKARPTMQVIGGVSVLLMLATTALLRAQDRAGPAQARQLIARALATSDSLLRTEPRLALRWAREARQLAATWGRGEEAGQAHERLARAYLELSELDTAMEHADTALAIAAALPGTMAGERAEQVKGEVYLRMGDLVSAVEHLETALDGATRRNDRKAMAAIRMRLANALYVGRQSKAVYAHLDTCDRIYRALNDRAGLAASYGRRAMAMAEDDEVDSLPLAKLYMDTARALARQAWDSLELTRIHANTTLIAMNMEDLDRARAHNDTALALARALQDSFLLVHIHENMGQLHFREHQPELALPECRVMLEYGIRHGILRLQRDGWHCVMNSLREAGDWKGAYDAYGEYWELNERMVNAYARERLLRRSLVQESARRELALREAHEAQRSNDRLWALLILVVLVATAAYLMLRQRAHMEREKATALRLRIDQHFVGNAMASLSGYVLKEERERAYDMLVRYDRFFRNTLDHSAAEAITLRQEMDALANYLAIEQALCGGRFQFALHIERALDPDAVHLPPMLVQPWVENAVKHGVKALSDGGRIDVRFTLDGRVLVVAVEDNGPGLRNPPDQAFPGSWGTRITGARLKALSRRCGRAGSYRYDPVERGTRVVLRLPTIRIS